MKKDMIRIQSSRRLEEVEEYYFSGKLSIIREMDRQGADVINLGIGSPDMPPSDETVRAMAASALDPSHHGYQPYRGTEELRTALAHWYAQTYGVTLNPSGEILPLLGSKEGILHISMAFLDPGDRALVPDPGYPAYAAATRLAGAVPVFYDLREPDWQPSFKELEQMDLSGVRVMWVNYPHMPTGASADEELWPKLIAFAKRHGILICNDNPYSLVLNDRRPFSILGAEGAMETALELNSLSKSHNMPGWRVGMVAGAKPFTDAVMKAGSNINSGMFLPVQQGAMTALRNSARWHEERNDEYRKRRKVAEEILAMIGCRWTPGQSGLFLWAKVPGTVGNTKEWVDRILLHARVFLTPGCIFGKNGNRHIRLSLCSPAEKLREAKRRIEAHIHIISPETIS